jgi:hypothetical protein
MRIEDFDYLANLTITNGKNRLLTGIRSDNLAAMFLVVWEDERYLFVYDKSPESIIEVRKVWSRYASNPELSFNWRDVARLCTMSNKMGFGIQNFYSNKH